MPSVVPGFDLDRQVRRSTARIYARGSDSVAGVMVGRLRSELE
jgi:hypothetical protein